LSPKYRDDFLTHPITTRLCDYQLIQIKAAIVLGHARYLPEILKSINFYSKLNEGEILDRFEFRKRELEYRTAIGVWKAALGDVNFAPKRPVLVPNPNISKYDKYICASRVTHGRRDDCRCRRVA